VDGNARKHFKAVTALALARLAQIHIVQDDITLSRAILEIHARWQSRDVRLKEIHTPSGNLYSYYVLQSGTVLIGFDNYPDTRVLKAKFGSDYRNHMGELVPHRHGRNKQSVELTEEMNAERFLDYLETFVDLE